LGPRPLLATSGRRHRADFSAVGWNESGTQPWRTTEINCQCGYAGRPIESPGE